MNAPLELSPKAQSILSTPMLALTAALVPMFAPQALSLRANKNIRNDYHKRQHPAVLPLFLCLHISERLTGNLMPPAEAISAQH